MLSYYYVRDVLEYKKVSTWPREKVMALQQERWQNLVKFVYKKSPYYKGVMKERGLSPETAKVEDFPVLTKQIILDHFDEIVTDPKIKLKEVTKFVEEGRPEKLYLNKYHVLKTSGSSGQAGYFLATSREVIASVTPSVARGFTGQNRIPKKLALIGFPQSFAGSSQTMNFCNRIWLAKKVVNYLPISIEQPFTEVIRQLNEFQPHILSGYAKLLLLVADAQRSGKLRISPDSIDSGGEQLLETDRRYLKETFSCAVNNHYGSTEGYSMGICRDGETGIELHEDHLIFSINENDTHITNLHGFTMPLIRYQMRDILVPRPFSEAKPFRRVEPQIGRSDEIPYFFTKDNGQVTVHPLAFDPLMPVEVKSFFMVSTKANEVVFHILLSDSGIVQKEQVIEKVQAMLKDFFSAKSLGHIEIQVLVDDDYHINQNSGKTKFWRNEVTRLIADHQE